MLCKVSTSIFITNSYTIIECDFRLYIVYEVKVIPTYNINWICAEY